MLFYCWSDVEDDGPTSKQHWVNVYCLLGMYISMHGCAVILHLTRRPRYLSIIMTYYRPLNMLINPQRVYNDVLYNVSVSVY